MPTTRYTPFPRRAHSFGGWSRSWSEAGGGCTRLRSSTGSIGGRGGGEPYRETRYGSVGEWHPTRRAEVARAVSGQRPPGRPRLRRLSKLRSPLGPRHMTPQKTATPHPTESRRAQNRGASGAGSLPASVSLVVSWRPLARVRDTPLYDGYSYERRDTEGHRGYGPIA